MSVSSSARHSSSQQNCHHVTQRPNDTWSASTSTMSPAPHYGWSSSRALMKNPHCWNHRTQRDMHSAQSTQHRSFCDEPDNVNDLADRAHNDRQRLDGWNCDSLTLPPSTAVHQQRRFQPVPSYRAAGRGRGQTYRHEMTFSHSMSVGHHQSDCHEWTGWVNGADHSGQWRQLSEWTPVMSRTQRRHQRRPRQPRRPHDMYQQRH